LPTKRIVLDGQFGSDYGARVGDDLALYERERIVHPAVWPALANRVFGTELVQGAWIHTRSVIRHHGLAHAGDAVDVRSTLIDEFERKGRRAVCDITIELAGVAIVSIEHEAIVELPDH
jgi:acyl dehydratase